MLPSDLDPLGRLAARFSSLLFRSGRGRPFPDDPRRILLLVPSGLGALICASPAFAALRRRFPQAMLLLGAPRGFEPLYEGAGLFDRFLPCDPPRRGIAAAAREFSRRARTEGVDLTFLFAGFGPTERLYARAAGAPVVGLVRGPEDRPGFAHGAPWRSDAHAVGLFLDLAEAAGAKTDDPALIPPRLRSSDREEIRTWFREAGCDRAKRRIAFHPGAGAWAPRRAWPVEKFALLAQRCAETGAATIVLGSPEDATRISRRFKQMASPPLDLTGRTSLRQLAAALAEVDLLVANDGGPVHLAAALGVPTVAIHGPESPSRFGPPDRIEHHVVSTVPPCGPCVSFFAGIHHECGRGEACLQELPVARVLAAVRETLQWLDDGDRLRRFAEERRMQRDN